MISIGLIFASQTQHPNLVTAEVFRVAKENVTHLALIGAELPKSFLRTDPKDRSRRFIGCATSAPYGSSPRVSVRVVDSSGDFNSAVVQCQVRGTQKISDA